MACIISMYYELLESAFIYNGKQSHTCIYVFYAILFLKNERGGLKSSGYSVIFRTQGSLQHPLDAAGLTPSAIHPKRVRAPPCLQWKGVDTMCEPIITLPWTCGFEDGCESAGISANTGSPRTAIPATRILTVTTKPSTKKTCLALKRSQKPGSTTQYVLESAWIR